MTTGENGNGSPKVMGGEQHWDAEHLMHSPTSHGGAPDSPTTMRKRLSVRNSVRHRLGRGKSKGKIEPSMWGMPGDLTKEEVEVYLKFRSEVEKRGGDFRDTIYCFGEEEGEAHALCRWLRARKFVYDDVTKMVEEATEVRAEAREHDFYPNAKDALGCDPSVFFAQYPQVYCGNAKNGAVLFVSKPGELDVDAMECITSLDGIIRYHWHAMMHDFATRLRAKKAEDPEFVRFECFCVLDLEHLTAGKLSSRAMTIIKQQSFIDSLCFPETMSKMIIVNAPRFFSATWRLVRGWLDARTASKVEVISGRGAMEKRLRELVPACDLPSDYGGTGPSTEAIILESRPGDMIRNSTELMHVRGHSSHSAEIKTGEALEIVVYTRSLEGAAISVTDADHKRREPYVTAVEVKHYNSDETMPPTSVKITSSRIVGPAHVKVKVDSHGGRFSSEMFLLAYNFYPK